VAQRLKTLFGFHRTRPGPGSVVQLTLPAHPVSLGGRCQPGLHVINLVQSGETSNAD
jgi:hypothetical protein